jgi:DNA-binding NtrC family response regulator
MRTLAMQKKPIVILDDDPLILSGMSRLLESAGLGKPTCFSRAADLAKGVAGGAAAVILDLVLPDGRGEDLLLELRSTHPEIPVIVVTGAGGVDAAVECMKAGAFDFFTKGGEPERLVASVRAALKADRQRRYCEYLRARLLDRRLEKPECFSKIVTRDESMLSLFLYLEAIAGTGEPVLLVGETGAGKELLAEAVHEASGLSGELVKINVAGLDDALFADALFGHRKGAFTGADETRAGLLRRACGGSILLDEIGDLSQNSQIKLLRLIETGEYYPTGSDSLERCDARFILSTHADLEERIVSGSFRRDLYYRISMHTAPVPPLRERSCDIPLLVSVFLDEANARKGTLSYRPSADDMERLRAYSFPGNVRELRSLIFDAAARGRLEVPGIAETAGRRAPDAKSVSFGSELPTLEGLEELLIAESLRRSGGNVSAAARVLGISRQGLSKRLGPRSDGQ